MDQDASDRKRVFSDEFDDTFALGPLPGNAAFVGRNVLRGLVEGSTRTRPRTIRVGARGRFFGES